MSGENGSSKGGTLVKAVLVLLLSLLSFSVGTFVGKSVSDSDHRKLALEGDYGGSREVASVEDHEGGREEKISEKEVENLTEEFVNKEKAAEEVAVAEEHEGGAQAKSGHEEKGHGTEKAGYQAYTRGTKNEAKDGTVTEDTHGTPAKHEVAAAKAAPAASKVDATHKVADKVAGGQAPSDGKPEERKPASTLPSVANSAVGKYTLQVGSYTEETEAKSHAASLKGKGWEAFYLPVKINNRQWYRVLVGLFENSKSAQDFRAQFMKEANTKSAIVQKIVQ